MFRISLYLKGVKLNGIQALDFCRSKNLPDTVYIYESFPRIDCDVDEMFARSWFPSDCVVSDGETATVDMLVPGELVLNEQRLNFAELSDARIKELFIAAKFRRLTK